MHIALHSLKMRKEDDKFILIMKIPTYLKKERSRPTHVVKSQAMKPYCSYKIRNSEQQLPKNKTKWYIYFDRYR